MPILGNIRHEIFAQAIARGESANKAYELAGYAPNPGNAQRLKCKEVIKLRVIELQAKAARRVDVTLAKLLADLEEVKEKAIDAEQFGSAVTALREMAILAQLRTEKVDKTVRFEDADGVSDEELLRIAKGESTGNGADHTTAFEEPPEGTHLN